MRTIEKNRVTHTGHNSNDLFGQLMGLLGNVLHYVVQFPSHSTWSQGCGRPSPTGRLNYSHSQQISSENNQVILEKECLQVQGPALELSS